MILLDAYALVALLAAEPQSADLVGELLRREPAGVTTVNLIEVAYVVHRERGIVPERVRGQVEALGERIVLVSLSERSAWAAAELRVRHYHRTKCPLSLADCALLASAGPEDTIVTADRFILEVARLEGIPTLTLPERAT